VFILLRGGWLVKVNIIFCAALLAALLCAPRGDAAWIVEADNVAPAGKANDHFSSLGHSLSTGFSTAAGLTGNQSAFGNPANSTGPDLYTFTYHVGLDPDNTVFVTGETLGNSTASDADGAGAGLPTYAIADHFASGKVGNRSGIYNVYFTAPSSTNVNALGSTITVNSDDPAVVLNPVNLNDTGTGPDMVAGVPFTGGANNRWLKIATVRLTAGNTYTVTVQANANPPDFVSQRAHGVMWEFHLVPEPGTAALVGLAIVSAVGMLRRRDG
jgi:hypothetical protein